MQTVFKTAVTRKPGRNCACGLTTSTLGAPEVELTLKQHDAYIKALRSIGLAVVVLDEQRSFPDAHFVEDTAVVTPQVGVIARPGAESRQGEEDSIEPLLARYRPTVRIRPPGTLDGGDVLMVGNHFFIGISGRTNDSGAEQLGHFLEDYGHTWEKMPVAGGLHLKSGINTLGRNTLIVSEEFTHKKALKGYDKIIVDAEEAYAANTLWINDHILMPAGFPQTRRKLDGLGADLIELEMSEFRKMDGGLTCLSLRF